MPHPGLPPMQDDEINAFTGRDMGGGGLSAAGGPTGGLADGPNPADVEFESDLPDSAMDVLGDTGGQPRENFGLRDLLRLNAILKADQGRRNTREARRERRRAAQGLADAEMLGWRWGQGKIGWAKSPAFWIKECPMISRISETRAGMPNHRASNYGSVSRRNVEGVLRGRRA